MAVALPMLPLSSAVRASSVDLGQRLPYNPRRTRPMKPDPLTTASPSTLTTAPEKRTPKISVPDLLKRSISNTVPEDIGSSYFGYETWLPDPPKVEKPRSVLNPASLAYIGDCIYELYARRHFLFPALNIEEYNDRVMAVVRCEAQDAMLQKLMSDKFLSQEERDVLRWGKNISSSKTRTKKRAGVAVYNRASSLETLVGYLYLTNVQRLEEIMGKIGFSTDTSNYLEEEKSIGGLIVDSKSRGATRGRKGKKYPEENNRSKDTTAMAATRPDPTTDDDPFESPV